MSEHYNLYYIVVTGNPTVGIEYYGPFASEEDAQKEADKHLDDETPRIEPLYESDFGVILDNDS
jgi:hypothetical protein